MPAYPSLFSSHLEWLRRDRCGIYSLEGGCRSASIDDDIYHSCGSHRPEERDAMIAYGALVNRAT